MSYPVRVAERRGVAALLETPRVVVGTIHSVKGAEADEVVLLPDLSRVGAEAYEGRGLGGKDSVLRTFYFGITRAKRRLVLCVGGRSPDRVKWLRPEVGVVEPF